jgi:hypothetical protein
MTDIIDYPKILRSIRAKLNVSQEQLGSVLRYGESMGRRHQAMFTSSQLRAIADALADTTEGLTGSEISHLLSVCKMLDTDPQITRRHRLYNAFVHSQNERQDALGF